MVKEFLEGAKMEADGFIHFHAPERNIHGSWFIRSVDTDDLGFYRFLSYDQHTRPYIVSFLLSPVNTHTRNTLYNSFERALEEYDYYYAYHGGLKSSDPAPPKIIESEVMEF